VEPSAAPVPPDLSPEALARLTTLEMPFGKHKGVLIADLPGNYLAWFAREGFPKGELGRLLALMLEIDHNGLRPLLDPLRRTPRPPQKERTPAVRATGH
jgi:uncharacterized protein (DUF3820 family)